MKQAFRQRGFPLLFAGLFTSMLGDSLMLIVLAIWVKSLTGSNGAAGLTFFFMAIPSLAAPVAGMFVDRVRRRTTLIWGNLASAVAMAPLLLVHDKQQVWIVYLVAALYGISWVVLPGALNGLLKEMLPEDLLVDANASLSTTKEALRLFGPLAGAGLYAWAGGGFVAALDALSFLVAAGAVLAIRIREDKPVRETGHWKAEFSAGMSHIWGDAILKHTLLAVAMALLVAGFMESAVFAAVQYYDKPASFVGVVVSVQGMGAVVGGLSSAWIIRRLGETESIALSLVLFAAGLAMAAASPWLWGFFCGTVVLGFALPVFIVALQTLLQRRTPQRLMGRVSAATDVLLGTPQSGSIALGALLVTLISFRSIFWVSAAVILASAGYLTWALRGAARPGPVDPVTAGIPLEPGVVGVGSVGQAATDRNTDQVGVHLPDGDPGRLRGERQERRLGHAGGDVRLEKPDGSVRGHDEVRAGQAAQSE
jgi:MFS family permease